MTAKYMYTLFCNSADGCDARFSCDSNRADFTRMEAARTKNWRWVWKQAEKNKGPGLSKDYCADHSHEAGDDNGKPLSAIAHNVQPDKVTSFSGAFRFLSNFYPVRIEYQGEVYTTLEHAFQAAKCELPIDRHRIRMTATASNAKQLGRQVLMRAGWATERLLVMKDLLRIKFKHPILRDQLMLTSPMELIEGNTWKDTFWGVCNGVGENWLGKLLMEVRAELLKTSTP